MKLFSRESSGQVWRSQEYLMSKANVCVMTMECSMGRLLAPEVIRTYEEMTDLLTIIAKSWVNAELAMAPDFCRSLSQDIFQISWLQLSDEIVCDAVIPFHQLDPLGREIEEIALWARYYTGAAAWDMLPADRKWDTDRPTNWPKSLMLVSSEERDARS